jgi:hypothetical protein
MSKRSCPHRNSCDPRSTAVPLIFDFVAPPVESSDILGGPGSCGESPEPSARPKRNFVQLALPLKLSRVRALLGARKEIGCGSAALRDT